MTGDEVAARAALMAAVEVVACGWERVAPYMPHSDEDAVRRLMRALDELQIEVAQTQRAVHDPLLLEERALSAAVSAIADAWYRIRPLLIDYNISAVDKEILSVQKSQ